MGDEELLKLEQIVEGKKKTKTKQKSQRVIKE